MDWLGLHFLTDLPVDGQILMDCRHNTVLVLLAYLVACAGSFATLDMAERVSQVEHPNAQRQWRWIGAFCLAGGIWSMHFIGMLAFQVPLEIHYNVALTAASLLLVLIAALLAMSTLSQTKLRWWQFLQAALVIGLGIAGMHYVGMAAIESHAVQYYDGRLFALSVGIAIAASLGALLLARHFRSGVSGGAHHQLLKYSASLLMGAGIVSMHLTGMWALTLVVPPGNSLQLAMQDNSLELGLTVAFITLLIIASSLSAAVSDKKLQSKEHDLRRVNALLSQLDQARMSLQQAAHYDALTNLVNRRGFNQLFAEKLAERTMTNGRLAVMFLDIDHFKRINDSLGHDAGDQLLKVIASHIKSAVRTHDDVVARFGGDEFCILIGLNQPEEARVMAHRIMSKMKEPVELGGRRMVMTTSIGIAVFPEDGTTSDELLKHADLALYQSKGSGRNSVHFFNDTLKNRATLELQLEEELRTALYEEHGLTLFYQPIFDLHNGRVAKIEALIRWRHPQHGLLSPDRFIGIAEANGLIAELDNWVLRRACRDLEALIDAGFHGLKTTVNCSALNLCREDLPGEIEAALLDVKIPPGSVELEVTENALMGNINTVIGILEQIRQLGVSLSIDDFGTGYSSLAYLKRLPLDTLKVDRSFMLDIPNSVQDMEIVQAIIVMAHTLHLQVVTEGVENAEQYRFLCDQGCDYVQGYLLSRPVPLNELKPLLTELNQRRSALPPEPATLAVRAEPAAEEVFTSARESSRAQPSR